jgi:myo-inositol 2-dehydrogenase/D-chiro-inositol 1-dehydrogenase/scyllo-inositol 2-dehydrogenase (NAD+)
VPAFAKMKNARLVAVADADQDRLGKIQKKFDVPGLYQDYRQLIDDPQVQAVVVSLPTALHAEATLAAIAAGKHVLCEMPLAARLEDVPGMIEAAQKAKVTLMPSLTFHFTSNYVKAKQLIDEGKLGNVISLMYREFIPAKDLAMQWPPGCWVWDIEKSGGPLYTLAVWSIDLLRWLSGSEIVEVKPATKYTKLDKYGGTLGYDAYASLRFANGMVGCLQYSGSVTHSASASRLEVIGDSTYMVDASHNDKVTLFTEDPFKSEWDVKEVGPRMWGHQQQDEYFVQCLLDGTQPSITADDGLKAMEVAVQIAKATA